MRYGPPVDPPDPCDHDNDKFTCYQCQEEREWAEDMAADAAYERWKLGE